MALQVPIHQTNRPPSPQCASDTISYDPSFIYNIIYILYSHSFNKPLCKILIKPRTRTKALFFLSFFFFLHFVISVECANVWMEGIMVGWNVLNVVPPHNICPLHIFQKKIYRISLCSGIPFESCILKLNLDTTLQQASPKHICSSRGIPVY